MGSPGRLNFIVKGSLLAGGFILTYFLSNTAPSDEFFRSFGETGYHVAKAFVMFSIGYLFSVFSRLVDRR